MIQDFKADFNELFDLIEGDTPFAFMRFADGEIGVMQGRSVIGSDNWRSPNSVTKLGTDLLEAISHTDSNVYYGISCQCCDIEGRDYLLSLIKTDRCNITFSNLFVNGNYEMFKDKLAKINLPVHLIANQSAIVDNFPCMIETFLPIPNDCVNFWQELSEDFKISLTSYYKDITGSVFLIAAGPMSEVIIDHLWKINPTNKYIDVGSAIAEYVHGHPIRDFAYKNSPYYNKNCIF